VASVDGAVTANGLSRGLQTPGDNAVFAALRDLSDVVLVGAGTARSENYRAARPSTERAALRQRWKLPPALPIAVVSRTLRLDPQAELFRGPTRTVVITSATSDPQARKRLAEVADVEVCGTDEVDLVATREALEKRGWYRILSEGGPSLFADLLRADVVDELCLSVTPLVIGPGAPRITGGTSGGSGKGDVVPVELVGLLEEDGALFARYRMTRS
jgi:riboflavin biosynthesis pyrimidine reductase